MRGYTKAERLGQLTKLAMLCSDIADAISADNAWEASGFRHFSNNARELAKTEFGQSDLNNISRTFLPEPDWLNAKAIDSGLVLTPAQERVSPVVREAIELARELRVIDRFPQTDLSAD